MPRKVTLDLQTLLPKVRKAYDAQRLQAQRPDIRAADQPSYCGPCAIGVGLTPYQRTRLDMSGSEYPSINTLIRDGYVVVPEGQAGDFNSLQTTHDNWIGSGSAHYFDGLLRELEAKYLHA